MKLIEDSGRLALVEIDGTDWHMSSEEYEIMLMRQFHCWPYNLKQINPQPRSCARCLNRPIDFCKSKERTVKEPRWKYKEGTTDQQIYDAILRDAVELTSEHDKLKNIRPCPVFSWSRASPFYNVLHCEAGEWNHDFTTF